MAPAKINLYLKVFDRRADGYHRIETLVIKLKLADRLIFRFSDRGELTVNVKGSPDLDGPANLAYRAAEAYFERAGISLLLSGNRG